MKKLGIPPFEINLSFAIVGVLIPLALIWIFRLPLGIKDWRRGTYWGIWVLWIGLVQGLGFTLAAIVPGGFKSIYGFFTLVTIALIMIACLWPIWKKVHFSGDNKMGWRLAILLGGMAVPGIVVISAVKPLIPTLAWQAYFIVAIAMGEELLYRGFIQNLLNRIWVKRWKFAGCSYGPGLLIAAFLFGFSHLYQLGSYTPNWSLALGACLAGVFFGLLYEKGGIWTPFIFHGFWSAIPEPIMIAWGVM